MKYPLTTAFFALTLAVQVSAVAAEEVRIEHNGLTLNANLEKADASWPAGPVVLMTHGTLAHRGLEIIEGLQGEDTSVKGLAEAVEAVADGERVRLTVIDGADHFFRDLYAEDIADAVAEQVGLD